MDTKGKAKRGELLIVGGIIFLAVLLVVGYKFVSTSSIIFDSTSTLATTLTQAYLDDTGNVHVVINKGRDIQLTTEGGFYHPKLASNGQTIGWLIITEYPQDEGGVLRVAEELVIYQDGQVINTIQPGGFIRDWEFWDDGKQVAIYTGALHFAGSYFLFDVDTGKVIDESGDLDENPPDWALFFRRG